MADVQTYTSNMGRNTHLSQSALDTFAINYAIAKLNTAIFVKVTQVDEVTDSSQPTGWVTVKQLVKDFDNEKEAIDSVEMFHLPYMRYQGGKCAFVVDPCVGDIGVAIFAQNDSSNIKQGSDEEVVVGSFRTFSRSDGMYIGGFLNKAPEIYIELLQNGKIVIKPTSSAADAVTIKGNTTIKGNLCVGGRIYSDDSEGVNCDVYIKGKIDATGDITAGTVSLEHHTHGGVETGGGNTGEPNA